jgi:hypothetical protein
VAPADQRACAAHQTRPAAPAGHLSQYGRGLERRFAMETGAMRGAGPRGERARTVARHDPPCDETRVPRACCDWDLGIALTPRGTAGDLALLAQESPGGRRRLAEAASASWRPAARFDQDGAKRAPPRLTPVCRRPLTPMRAPRPGTPYCVTTHSMPEPSSRAYAPAPSTP